MDKHAGPDDNQTLIIKVLLGVFVSMFVVNTIAQFLQLPYKDPVYVMSLAIPIFSAVVFHYYKRMAAQAAPSKKSVLLIEDSQLWARIIRLTMKPETHEVSVVSNTEDAMTLLLSNVGCCNELPDEIILDFGLPTSAEFLSKLKSDGRLEHIPVTILASTSREDEPEDQAAEAWVSKLESGAILKIPEKKEMQGVRRF